MSADSVALPKLAILGGTGKEGSGLALRWASVGYPVVIGSRQLEKAQSVAAELNAVLGRQGVTGLENGQAARQADMCILTVVQEAHQAALQGLRDDLQGKVIVDATARVDFRDPRPPAPPAAARLAQEILGPGATVVAAFQNVPAHLLKKNLGESIAAEVLVCADAIPAAEAVITLAGAAGMRAYYAGGLDNALIVEGLTAVLISLNKYYGKKTASIHITGLSA